MRRAINFLGSLAPRSSPTGNLWRQTAFLKLWAASTISQAGSQVSLLALPLTAVLVLGAAPAQMGLLVAAGEVPSLLFGLFAGAWVDRLRRRPLLIAADVGRALLYGSIPTAALLGRLQIGQLYLVAFSGGALGVLSGVASGAFLPSVVAPEQLVEANSRFQATRSAAQVVGPGLAGVLVQALTAPVAVAVDALSYVVSAFLLGRLRTPEPASPGRSRPAIWRQIAEGIRVTLHHPLLGWIALATVLGGFFDSAFFSQYTLYVTRELGLAPSALGAIFALGGSGGIVGAVLAEQAARRIGVGPAIVTGVLLIGIGDAVIPLASFFPTMAGPLLAAAELVVVFGATTFGVNQASLLQAIVPDRLRGRVNATMRVTGGAAGTLGPLAGGIVATAIGLRPLFLIAGPCTAIAGILLLRSPVWRVRTLSASVMAVAPERVHEGTA